MTQSKSPYNPNKTERRKRNGVPYFKRLRNLGGNKSKINPSATVRRIYRKRVKNSTCRKKNRTACGKAPQCVPVSTKKRKYCRNRSNRYRLARVLGEGRKRRRTNI